MFDDSMQTENRLQDDGLYKYLSAERCYQALENDTIRFSSPLLFNDPFDISQVLLGNIDKDINIAKERCYNHIIEHITHVDASSYRIISDMRLHGIQSVLIKYRNIFFDAMTKSGNWGNNVNEEMIKNVIKQGKLFINNNKNNIISELDEKSDLKLQQENWKQLIRKLRIFCLSSQKDNIPLWYHYADQYKGAVISFNKLISDEDDFSTFALLRQIKYEKNIEYYMYYFWSNYLLSNNEQYVFDSMFRKGENWKYEHEKRIITYDQNYDGKLYSDIKINKGYINAIYLGPEITTYDKDKLIALADDKYQVPIYQMMTKNQIVFEQIN